MKERSNAVAMMVLHMSSHMVSGGKNMTTCYHQWRMFALERQMEPFRIVTFNVFFLTEAFLRVAVAGSITSLDPVPQASFMTTDNGLFFKDQTQRIKRSEWSYFQIYMRSLHIFTFLDPLVHFKKKVLTCAVLGTYWWIFAFNCIAKAVRTCPQVRGAGGVVFRYS